MAIFTSKKAILKRIHELGLLAVIRGPSPELATKMVDALIAGGVYGIEITYTTPEATRVVNSLDEKYGDQILLGMGTLRYPEQAAQAQEAGARFIVSPHWEDKLAREMVSSGLVVMIGALTPSEIVRAYHLGSDVVKLFPGFLVGPKYMKALRGLFPDIPMVPTGGVSAKNLGDWFSAGAFAVGAGSELCPGTWAKEGRFEDITARARHFLQALEQVRGLVR